VVEDDAETADYIVGGLRQDGFTVEQVADGRDGLFLGSGGGFDALVMDRMVPGMDGLSVVRALRAAGVETPILFLSALSHLDEKVKGLRAGGDDYLTKPFGYSELLARLENLMRRGPGRDVQTELVCGDLTMNLLSRRVTRAGDVIDLLPREFKLLGWGGGEGGRVSTGRSARQQVWAYRVDPHTWSIATHSGSGCRKIDDPYARPLLHTLRGTGYRFSETP